MQSRFGLAHFFVFIFCGLVSITACCIGVFGVIAHNTHTPNYDIVQARSTTNNASDIDQVRNAIAHPKNKKWEPVFVLSRNDVFSHSEN